MNKQEAIEQIRDKSQRFYACDYISRNEVSGIINQIDEPQKVTIPKFVAEWVEFCRSNKFYLYTAFDPVDELGQALANDFEGDGLRCTRWAKNNSDTFARAWLDGYEVEKEKLYWVRDKNGESILVKVLGDISVSSGYNIDYQRNYRNYYTFTEKEIKDYDERYWAFAVPVEVE